MAMIAPFPKPLVKVQMNTLLDKRYKTYHISYFRFFQSEMKISISVRKNSRPRKSTAGVIFCAGGRGTLSFFSTHFTFTGTLGDPFRSVEAYDWRRNHWLAVPEMTQQRRHVGVVSVKGKLYAIGGHDGQTHLATAEVFDPIAGAWRRIAPMNTSRRYGTTTSL